MPLKVRMLTKFSLNSRLCNVSGVPAFLGMCTTRQLLTYIYMCVCSSPPLFFCMNNGIEKQQQAAQPFEVSRSRYTSNPCVDTLRFSLSRARFWSCRILSFDSPYMSPITWRVLGSPS